MTNSGLTWARQRTAGPLGSRPVRVICQRLLQPTGHSRRRSLSLGRSAVMRNCILILTLVFLATGCSERRFRQNGSSAMSPSIQPNESFVADMAAFRKSGPQRWDVVVFHPPPRETLAQTQEIWVMRIVGLPGESLEIRDDGVYVGGKRETQPARLAGIRYVANTSRSSLPSVTYPYKLAADTYFLVGDNTSNSFDSRFWGGLSRQSILGRVKNK
jgi:signal peptidase I